MARFILITGMMGAGKSAVSDLLRMKHYIVIDSDKEVKELYDEPEIFQFVVNHFGKDCLNDDNKIDFNFLRKAFAHNSLFNDDLMKRLLAKFCNKLEEKYKNSKEVIFVEAALTPDIQHFRARLNMFDMIIVHASDDIRYNRLIQRPNYDENMRVLEKRQSLENLNVWATGVYVPHYAIFHIENNENLEDLNTNVIEALQNLGISHEEKFATYIRYLKEAPTYCHDNAWCYSFFNLGGCNNCPFPCKNIDRDYKKLHEKFIEEQKKANSKEKKWNEYMDAWADEYNQAQKDSKEFYITRTSHGDNN
jgi:dephospho-CoA kinase